MVKLSRRKLAIYVADGLNRGEATTKLMKELAAYLIDSKRVGELELIVRDIEARLAADGTVVVTATSARPLSAVAKEALADLVKRDYGTKSSVVFRETVDAAGRAVAPGFIDAHTHYDAQAFWDPTFSPSCYHGVTTIVGGFCGFSIAPITPEAADYIKPMLARVEGMPLDTLDKAVPWNWRSFGDYLALLDGKIGLNAGFFAGHSPIRRIVMSAPGETPAG